jgi:hypothetical protein
MTAATELPGDVDDHIRAVAYGMIALYVTSGQGDETVGAEWIRRAYQFSRQGRRDHPLLEFVDAMESLLHGLEAGLAAFERLRDSDDPWVRAMGRWQSGKMRIMLGRGGPDVEADLETALAEFTAIGERFGMSLALSELAAWLAVRGDFTGACARYDQGVHVLTEIGAVEDVIEMLTQQALVHRLNGDPAAATSAVREAERIAEGVTWPYALVSIALAKAELARQDGDREQARRLIDRATALLGELAAMPYMQSMVHQQLGYLAEDLAEARTHRLAAWRAAAGMMAPTIVSRVLVGVADQAARAGNHEQAARLLGAVAVLRGTPDRSNPDEARVEQQARRHLGEQRFAEVTQQGRSADVSDLVEAVLS